MKDIRIFVASSRELERERNYLAYLVLANEEEFARRGFRVRLAKWEYVDPKMTAERTEDRYLEEMYNCDAAIVLFKNIVGTYTREEMDKAISAEHGGWSRLKAHRILFSAAGAQDSGAARLRESLSSDGYGVYSNMDELKEAFLSLVDYVAKCERLLDAPSDKHVHTIAAFLAADDELAEDRNAFADTVLNVNDLLEQGHLNVRVQLKFYDSANAEKVVESSEMGLVLYGTNYRVLGREDVERIHARMKDGRQNPKCVYVFFRNLDNYAEKVLDEAFKRFRSELESRFEHFSCHFGDANGIRAVFDEFLLRYVGGTIDKKDTKELYSTVTVPTASAFVGREDELRKLHELLEPVPDRFPVGRLPIITGAGGTGKSELVRQYASQLCVQYPGGVLQVDMEHVKTWDEAFLGILKGVSNNGVNVADFLDLKSNGKESKESVPLTGAEVRDALLRHARESGPVLLVMDNVEEFTSLLEQDGGFKEAFPAGVSEGVRVNVVATARACDVVLRPTDWAVSFPLADLSPEFALELLLKDKQAKGEKELSAARRIAELLGYRALYLRRVPAILKGGNKKSRIVCRSYASLAGALEKDPLLTINRTATVDDKYLPTRLWELAQSSLAEWGLGEACIKLIKIASFFSPNGFAKHILRHLWDDLVFPGLEDLGSKDEVFDEVVDLARRYNIFQSVDPVRIHRLDRAAILQTAQAEPGLEEAVGMALATYEGMSPECWLLLADCVEILRYAPGEVRSHFGETTVSLQAMLLCLNAKCNYIDVLKKLDGWDLAYLLGRKPEFQDKCPWEKLDGHAWAELLGCQPQFADRCSWEKLDGWDWARLLGRQPQFADMRSFTFEKLNSRNWANLLGHQPQFSKDCSWTRLKRELSAWHWSHLLSRQPRFEDKCPWKKLDGWDWARLLRLQPRFEDKCPWAKLDGKAWARLLGRQPRFAGKCSWAKLDGKAWARLLSRQPRFAKGCPWKKLSAWNWACLLSRQPQFADMDECPWEKFDGYVWARLLSYQPQFAERCSWKKLGGNAWADLLCHQPQFSHRCSWGMLDGNAWLRLLVCQPQFFHRCPFVLFDGNAWVHLLVCQPRFADCCPWEMLGGTNWAQLLAERPDFVGFCHWAKFSKDDWALLLEEQPQFACYVHTRPKGETN